MTCLPRAPAGVASAGGSETSVDQASDGAGSSADGGTGSAADLPWLGSTSYHGHLRPHRPRGQNLDSAPNRLGGTRMPTPPQGNVARGHGMGGRLLGGRHTLTGPGQPIGGDLGGVVRSRQCSRTIRRTSLTRAKIGHAPRAPPSLKTDVETRCHRARRERNESIQGLAKKVVWNVSGRTRPSAKTLGPCSPRGLASPMRFLSRDIQTQVTRLIGRSFWDLEVSLPQCRYVGCSDSR